MKTAAAIPPHPLLVFNRGGVAVDVAHLLRPGVPLHHRFMDTLRSLITGKRAEGAAEGRFTRQGGDHVPAAELPQRGPGQQGVNQRPGEGELIDVFERA